MSKEQSGRLARKAEHFIRSRLAGREGFRINVVRSGQKLPPRIVRHRPDVCAQAYVMDQAVELIGGAKARLNQCTAHQLAEIVRYLEGSEYRGLVLVVPRHSRPHFERLLRKVAVNWSLVRPRIRLIEG